MLFKLVFNTRDRRFYFVQAFNFHVLNVLTFYRLNPKSIVVSSLLKKYTLICQQIVPFGSIELKVPSFIGFRQKRLFYQNLNHRLRA